MGLNKTHISLCLISAFLFFAGWPTFGNPVFLFLIFVPIFFIQKKINEDNNKNKNFRVWFYSYFTFLLWNLSTTWWLINASLSGMIIANTFNALFFSIIFLFYQWGRKRLPSNGSYILLISTWVSFEKLHLLWSISWPWLNLGNGFSDYIYWVQWYEYTGTMGGTLWILILNIGFFETFKNLKKPYMIKNTLNKSIKLFLGITFPILISLLIYINHEDSLNKIKVVLVQPNIDPYDEKYIYSNQDLLEKFNKQIEKYKNTDIDFILLPETYFSEGFGERLNGFELNEFNKKIKSSLDEFKKTQLISGIQFYNTYSDQNKTKTSNKIKKNLWVDYYNSAICFSHEEKTNYYHKSKLVVGVETLPYSEYIMPIFGEYMVDLGGTVSNRVTQKNRSVFYHHQKKIISAPVICYESIYGEFSTEYIRLGADFLAVISNDAWWGNTQGHKQLLSYTRLRAIENRRSIARSANTGISALINENGEYLKKLDYGLEGTIAGEIPIVKKITFYTKYGDYIGRISVLIFLLYFSVAVSGRFKKKIHNF
tara:strand:- start:45 stop:1661 length:1617 start_codon:yes stop_codon:yes gene_type:complete